MMHETQRARIFLFLLVLACFVEQVEAVSQGVQITIIVICVIAGTISFGILLWATWGSGMAFFEQCYDQYIKKPDTTGSADQKTQPKNLAIAA
mmetsp:Transcript_17200/g.30855  ORF Transcript_17200/g.30855 Transcript_17200/m.30855 type:complete len:93 (-) Transcript_17200:93-371(-)